jgi:FkbM family methyltransferase
LGGITQTCTNNGSTALAVQKDTAPEAPVLRTLPCKNPAARSVVISAFPRPYRVYVHQIGQDNIVSESIVNGQYNGRWFEAHIRAQILDKLQLSNETNPLILDIGANIGIHALYLASLGYEVHGFEPLPGNYELLECSIASNEFRNLHLNNYGLGPKKTEVCMSSAQGNMGHSFITTNSVCASKMRVEVLGDYLHTVLKGRVPYLVKIDVEGYEFNALESATDYFEKYGKPKYIFSEFAPTFIESTGRKPRDYILWLEGLGYKVTRNGGIPVTSANVPTGATILDILASAI